MSTFSSGNKSFTCIYIGKYWPKIISEIIIQYHHAPSKKRENSCDISQYVSHYLKHCLGSRRDCGYCAGGLGWGCRLEKSRPQCVKSTHLELGKILHFFTLLFSFSYFPIRFNFPYPLYLCMCYSFVLLLLFSSYPAFSFAFLSLFCGQTSTVRQTANKALSLPNLVDNYLIIWALSLPLSFCCT